MEKLIEAATRARQRAHAPYSGFPVGAALLTTGGRIFTGCNVENSSYGLSICAERVALFNALAAGCRKFEMLAVVADTQKPCPPCGACRQVLLEFCSELRVIMANLEGETRELGLDELLPAAFSSRELNSAE